MKTPAFGYLFLMQKVYSYRVVRRVLIYFKSELFRGDRRGLLKALALLQRRWEATSNLKYKNPDEIWRSSFDIFNKTLTQITIYISLLITLFEIVDNIS